MREALPAGTHKHFIDFAVETAVARAPRSVEAWASLARDFVANVIPERISFADADLAPRRRKARVIDRPRLLHGAPRKPKSYRTEYLAHRVLRKECGCIDGPA